MIEKDLDKVLNYMKQYVENIYEHDSEPMLNWKDLKLVLEEIERLNKEIKEYQEELEKADSITQSCIFEGKEEATMSYRECLNLLERLHYIINKAIEYIENYINQFNGVYPVADKRYLDLHKLLRILKGVDKE